MRASWPTVSDEESRAYLTELGRELEPAARDLRSVDPEQFARKASDR